MDSFKPPAALSLQGNPSENWRRWIQRFDLYLTASGKIKEDEKVQCAILLHAGAGNLQYLQIRCE